MFRSLKINPFAAPSDVKLLFRANQLPRLYSEAIAEDDVEYWGLFYTTFDNQYDVLNLFTSSDIIKTLQQQPKNIVTLVHVLTDHIEDLLQNDEFPTIAEDQGLVAGLASFRPSFFAGRSAQHGKAEKPDLTRELLNCLRVLSRLIPFILSKEYASIEQQAFWLPRSSRASRKAEQPEDSHFVIDDEEDEPGPTSTGSSGNSAGPSGSPLAERLLDLSVDLLFVYGFTLPPSNSPGIIRKVAFNIWENGIGSTVSSPSDRHIDSNRVEVLRFILSMLSKTLYVPSTAYTAAANLNDPYSSSDSTPLPNFNPWHTYFVRQQITAKGRKSTLSFLCSLLNVAFKSGAAQAASANTLTSTVGGAVGDSYEKLVSGGKRKVDSPRLALVKACVQVLNVILVTITPDAMASNRPTATSPPATPQLQRAGSSSALASTPAAQNNTFQFFLAKLHRSSDLSFLAENLIVILLQPMNSSYLKLPLEAVGVSSAASPGLATDFLILMWKLTESNPRFVEHLLQSEQSVHSCMSILMYTCLEHRDNPAQFGLVKLAAFLLQSWSIERRFGAALNTPLSSHIPMPSKYAVPGTAADFLIQHIYTMIFSTKGAFNSIYPAFVLTLSNISPYIKNPTIRSSTRFIQLFLAMSNPGFLLSDEASPRLMFYLLEALNNVIYHQLTECPHLVYAIIRSHARFEELANFTLTGAVESIRQRRKDRSSGLKTPPKTPRRVSLASERTELNVSTDLDEMTQTRIQDEEKAALADREAARLRESQPNSPASEYPPVLPTSFTVSEKVRGKQRARSSSQVTLADSRNASQADLSSLYGGELRDDENEPYVSKNGFVPTEGWVASWREGLPIDGILILISECLPKISSLSSFSSGSNSAAVEKYLRGIDLAGLLPPAAPSKSRPFQTGSLHSILWLMSLAWGNIYVQSLENTNANNGLSNWRDTNIRLFNVRQGATGGLQGGVGQVQAAVSSLVEQGLGMLSLGTTSPAPAISGRPRRAPNGTPRRSMSGNSFGVV